jgi:hypothetical protein
MIVLGEIVSNRTICDEFGVGIMGGIRFCKKRNTIVLVSNSTDTTFANEWNDDVLHFVGRGAVGPQKFTAQNKTLANSTRSGAQIHLFEVFKKGEYVYAGQVELAGDPYRSEQVDARAENRFVWKFPLRRKFTGYPSAAEDSKPADGRRREHLPPGAYAVIDAALDADQQKMVDEVLDELKRHGILVFDQRDLDEKRYSATLARWHQQVLAIVRRRVRSLIARKKQTMKDASAFLADDELRINNTSSEQELRQALALLDYDDPVLMETIFEDARQAVPMPDPPASLTTPAKAPEEVSGLELACARRPRPFGGFT